MVGFFLVVTLGVFSVLFRDSSVATSRQGEARYQTVTVGAGQTLWDIARRVVPRADPRDVVVRIIRFNALPSALVQPGQEIAVPDYW